MVKREKAVGKHEEDPESKFKWAVARAIHTLRHADEPMDVFDFVKHWEGWNEEEAKEISNRAQEDEACWNLSLDLTTLPGYKPVSLLPDGSFRYAGVAFSANDAENMKRLEAGELSPYWASAYRSYYDLPDIAVVETNDKYL